MLGGQGTGNTGQQGTGNVGGQGTGNVGTLPTAGSKTPTYSGAKVLDNPLKGNIDSVCDLVIALVKAAIIIGIPIAILFIVWAGFKFILAQGNSDALKDARRNFLNVVIGIAIFVGSSLIASVIVNTLQQLGVQGINSC